jgi:hypothetical protein
MAKIDHERFAELARKAKVLRDVWRRERGGRLTEQLALNAAVRQRWLESNQNEAR